MSDSIDWSYISDMESSIGVSSDILNNDDDDEGSDSASEYYDANEVDPNERTVSNNQTININSTQQDLKQIPNSESQPVLEVKGQQVQGLEEQCIQKVDIQHISDLKNQQEQFANFQDVDVLESRRQISCGMDVGVENRPVRKISVDDNTCAVFENEVDPNERTVSNNKTININSTQQNLKQISNSESQPVLEVKGQQVQGLEEQCIQEVETQSQLPQIELNEDQMFAIGKDLKGPVVGREHVPDIENKKVKCVDNQQIRTLEDQYAPREKEINTNDQSYPKTFGVFRNEDTIPDEQLKVTEENFPKISSNPRCQNIATTENNSKSKNVLPKEQPEFDLAFSADEIYEQIIIEGDQDNAEMPPTEELNNISEQRLFIEKIGLEKFFPNRMTPQNVMTIKPLQEVLSYTEIPWLILKHLMMINYTSRDKIVEEYLAKIPGEEKHLSSESDELTLELDTESSEENENVNPLDLIISIFKCCSPVLQNILATKLFMCKLAVPFAIPDEEKIILKTSLLHAIVIDDKCSSKKVCQHLAIDSQCRTVAFVRFGRPAISKSAILNTILFTECQSFHNTFFNENCSLGKTDRNISDGLVEIAWLQPIGNHPLCEKVTTLFNLRGDCFNHNKQLQVLTKISDVIVMFIEMTNLQNKDFVESLKNLLSSETSGIVLAIDAYNNDEQTKNRIWKDFQHHIREQESRTKFFLVAKSKKSKSTQEIYKTLCSQIKALMGSTNGGSLSCRLSANLPDGVSKDDDTSEYKQTKENVTKIVNLIPENVIDIKDKLTPLQGKTWKSWSEKFKMINKSSHSNLFERDKVVKEMKDIRLDQLSIWRKNDPFMKVCIDVLLKTVKCESDFILLVDWLKLTLEDRSRGVYSKAFMEYQDALQILNQARQDAQLEKEFNEKRTSLAESSFRFDHIMREIGQIYESLLECKKNTNKDEKELLNSLPLLAAKLLLIGQPFEIMDGDASNIPLLWVKAVFQKLTEIVGDKRILSLSVVGLQSSGKSTLLNTMFGLQFAVGAGRCTRGVFMQLLPVKRDRFGFDFVFVIDTEGLQAPDQQFTHYNKLATFVIGLGDITVVNVYGENTAEVKNFLQIAVHAFLRLKLVNQRLNLKQSCIFIHQNVAAADAGEKMIDERQVLLRTLDDMTKEAAKQENIEGVRSFSQVIEFDTEENVLYFPALWNGNPPMAPTNPGYSTRVLEVKDTILYRLAEKRKTFLTVTDTIARIEDLWCGILRDDFVHSFRNTLELKAYNSLERKYHSIMWELEKAAREFRLSDAKNKLMKCNAGDDLERVASSLCLALTQEMEKKVTMSTKKLSVFIENSTLRDVMVQWEQSKIHRLKLEADNIIFKSRSEINTLKEELRIAQIQNTEKAIHQQNINQMAQRLAYELKGNMPNEDVMKEKFNTMWINWFNRFNAKQSDDTYFVKEQIDQLLLSNFEAYLSYMKREDSSSPVYKEMVQLVGSITTDDITDEYVSLRKFLSEPDVNDSEAEMRQIKQQTVDVTNKMFRKIDLKLKEISEQDVRFDISYAREVLHIVESDISSHNENTSGHLHFSLPSTFKAMIINHVACYITGVFTTLHDRYNRKHSPLRQIEDYQATAWKLFRDLVESKAEDMITVGFFKSAIVQAVTDHVTSFISLDVEENVYLKFKQEKYQLMKAIMMDLAEKSDFDNYMVFIQDPGSYAREWVNDFLNREIFDKETATDNRYFLFAKSRIDKIFAEIEKCTDNSESLKQADNTIETQSMQWISLFIEKMSNCNILPLKREMFTHMLSRNISDTKNFEQILNDEMATMKTDVYSNFKNINSENVQWKSHPINDIMAKLWGCPEICMFCKEPCKNTDTEHVKFGFPHDCIQHRPQGIGGYTYIHDDTLAIDSCNSLIQNEAAYYQCGNGKERPYKEYKYQFPNWEIQPTHDTSRYWMWFMCTYRQLLPKLSSYRRAKPPNIPATWNEISKEEALSSL